jgi:hypothetical protein
MIPDSRAVDGQAYPSNDSSAARLRGGQCVLSFHSLLPHGAHIGSSGWTHNLGPQASAAGVVILSTLAILVITGASLWVTIIAGEFGFAIAFGVILDLMIFPEFVRLYNS